MTIGRRVAVIGFTILGLVGLAVVWVAGLELYKYHWRLPRERLVTTATIDEWRINTPRRGGPRHQIRYHFTVPGGDTTYVAQEEILWITRENLWITIDRDVWEGSHETGSIEIEYSTQDPTINEPVAAHNSMGDLLAGSALGLGAVAFAGIGIWAPERFRRKPPSEVVDERPTTTV
ncbi:MAG: hypothetical protein ABR505_05855 [Actinomycetota bacterium]